MSRKLEAAVNARALALRRLSSALVFAESALQDTTLHVEFKMRYANLDKLYSSFEVAQTQVMSLVTGDGLEEELDKGLEADTIYYKIKVIYSEIFTRVDNKQGNVTHDQNVSISKDRLPSIKLPTFNGDLSHWSAFHDLYLSMVHNNTNLSNVEKFQYLLLSVSGEPLNIVRTLQLSDVNYIPAYESLVARYQDKRSLAFNHWETINSIAPIKLESAKGLRKICDTFEENLSGLTALGFPTGDWDFVLLCLMLKKIDAGTRTLFERSYSEFEVPSYKQLSKFVLSQAKALDKADISATTFKKTMATPPMHSKTHSFFAKTEKQNCALCKQLHSLTNCDDFAKLSPEERFRVVKQFNLCINCLNAGHQLSKCPSKFSCRDCNSKHHTLLHFRKRIMLSEEKEIKPSSSQEVVHNMSVMTNSISSVSILLATALVDIQDRQGRYQTVRVLLDSGSQANLISENCFHRLGLSRSPLMTSIHGIGQNTLSSNGFASCVISPRNDSSTTLNIDALIVKNICSDMPQSSFDASSWTHIKNLNLADPHFGVSSKIDILLGADIFPVILIDGRLSGKESEPIAINTLFGWVIMGRFKSTIRNSVNSLHVSFDDLNHTLKTFWEVEQIPTLDIMQSPEDIEAENHFVGTHKRTINGSYVVGLPFKSQTKPIFENSREIALRRFLTLERRFLCNSQLANSYREFMNTYIANNFMEKVDIPVESSGKFCYLPHHCVTKNESTTTKLRVVFDASARDRCGVSLNDTLLIGPKLHNNLFDILLKFRIPRIVFTADIQLMYLQIFVAPSDSNYQRILWRSSVDEPITDYKLKTVTFGVSASPFLALRTLKQLALDEKCNFPNASEVLLTDIYVDDVITGTDSVESAINLKNELIHLCRSGGFNLRKFNSNNPSLVASDDSEISFDTEKSVVKVLGLRWQPQEDIFSYQISPLSRKCTKRVILSELARMFDPLGFLAPLTFYVKHLIQILWCEGLDWDDEPSPPVVGCWQQFQTELPLLSEIKLNRCLSPKIGNFYDLAGFADASEKGYAAVVYLRISSDYGEININLISAKSKVAPIKRLSIPRLELCAAVLLAQLFAEIYRVCSQKIVIRHVFGWSDSRVALEWIRSSPHRWKPFVGNRIACIQENAPWCHWSHVNTANNPADCASRGLMPSDLISHSLWWNGPAFLKESFKTFDPLVSTEESPNEVLIEEKKCILIAKIAEPSFVDNLLESFSSLRKIQRIIVYMQRFVYNIKNPMNKLVGPIVAQEMHKALLIVIEHVQSVVFSEELQIIKNGKRLSKPLRFLNLFKDSGNILRVGGRLTHSNLSYEARHPILLPKEHCLTQRIISITHNENMHPGLNTLHSLLRQQFWIISARRAIRSVVSRCYRCYRLNPKPFQTPVGDLPNKRISQIKPFSCVGVDYGGPFSVNLNRSRGSKTCKAYLCLFVCFATKALHLELASDLSTEAFLAALRRFIARRGRCNQIYSDNGTNFVGASRQLAKHMQEAVESEQITWSFIPASAPHFGGLWEAGIKSVKTHLARVIGEQVLSFEELYTVIVQIEALLNSRPLCAVSADPTDLTVLTPGHFLTLEPLTVVPDDDLSNIKLNRLTRWQLLQSMHQSFWQRWQNEYLHSLQQRYNVKGPVQNIEIGTLVVVKNEQLPPIRWNLGRVIELHSGNDGICRVATIRTASGAIRRPVVKLCPLPSQ